MRKLIQGIVDFRQRTRPQVKDLFAQLALGQRPDTLLIACSDSRVAPNVFASSDPGDMFVLRNVGNLIPPCCPGEVNPWGGVAPAIEFALLNLPVTDIVICGHSECGAMLALLNGRTKVEGDHLQAWLTNGEESLKRLEKYGPLNPALAPHNQLSQQNVLQQMDHLRSYALVREREERHQLRIHGWWFDIREAEVYGYEETEKRFRVIDETYAKVINQRFPATKA
jgi:carbonic anhydrase